MLVFPQLLLTRCGRGAVQTGVIHLPGIESQEQTPAWKPQLAVGQKLLSGHSFPIVFAVYRQRKLIRSWGLCGAWENMGQTCLKFNFNDLNLSFRKTTKGEIFPFGFIMLPAE